VAGGAAGGVGGGGELVTINTREAVLLTGAGFSRPFGGYLVSEMWAAIFRQREIRASSTLRAKLLAQMNFETVYEDIASSNQFEMTQDLGEAIWRSYDHMQAAMNTEPNRNDARQMYVRFLSRFGATDSAERGFVFTLNQDVLIESAGQGQPQLPGVPLDQQPGTRIQLPGEDGVSTAEASFEQSGGGSLAYVKLHGSFNWWRFNASRALVIGTNKGPLLQSEPLLRWYQRLFRDVLSQYNRRLLVIGYSFRDRHINDVILDAVKNCGLKLFVMSPETPERFRAHLQSVERPSASASWVVERGDEIWNALYGYYCGSVEQFYTLNQSTLAPPPAGQALFSDLGVLE
jgi:hypothetical protein